MSNFTCFLIDDDDDDQEILRTVIDTVAPTWKCFSAMNGQTALEMLQSQRVVPDIVFLDLNMPLMNGHQFLQEVNKLKILQSVPIIVLTTSADPSTKAAVLELGARLFITKPDKFSDWETALKQVIDNCL